MFEDSISPQRPAATPRRFAWLHLLWSIPAAVAYAAVPLFLASLEKCGISGCSGGGYGVSYGDPVVTMSLVLVAVGILVTPIIAVPWIRSWKVRLVTAVIIGVPLLIVLFAVLMPPGR